MVMTTRASIRKWRLEPAQEETGLGGANKVGRVGSDGALREQIKEWAGDGSIRKRQDLVKAGGYAARGSFGLRWMLCG